MKTFENDHLSLRIDCSVHLLVQTWTGLPDSANFRDASLATLALAKRHQINRWLIDLRELRLFNPLDIHWFIQQWLPQASANLPRNTRIAIVLTDLNQFSKLGTDLIIRASIAQNPALSCRYFTDYSNSRQWLLTKRS